MPLPPRHRRLRRMLNLVPYANRKEGVSVDELAADLGCSRKDILADISMLNIAGPDNLSPDELIEITVENNQVYVELAQRLNRPTRLSGTEAAALSVAARVLAPNNPEVQTAEAKLSNAVSKVHREIYDTLLERLIPKSAAEDRSLSEMAELLNRGISERREVELEYFSRYSLKAGRRRIKPRQIFWHEGSTYLAAVTEDGGERVFRLDRIATAELTGKRFEPLPEFDARESVRRAVELAENSELPKASLLFSPTVLSHARSRHSGGQVQEDGSFLVSLSYASMEWLITYTLSWSGNATVLEPQEAREALLRELDRIEAEHSDVSPEK